MILAQQVVAPSGLARAWTFEPTVLFALVLAAAVYARGSARLRRRPLRTASYYLGLVVLAVALVSPLDAAAAALFSAHMIQHLLLMVVAAPLLAYSKPSAALLAGLPSEARAAVHRTAARPRVHATVQFLTHPIVVWTIGAVSLWAWHLPTLYQLALAHEPLHALEHVTFLGSALLFWSLVLDSGSRRGLPRPIAALLVFGTGVQSNALGAVLLFATRPLYPVHAAGAAVWHTTPLADQEVAGGLMWGPPNLLYVLFLGWLLVRWFAEMDERQAQPELAVVRGHR